MALDLLNPSSPAMGGGGGAPWVDPAAPQKPPAPSGAMGLGSRGPAMTGVWGRSAGAVGGPVTTRTPQGGYRPLTPGPVGAGNIGGGSVGGAGGPGGAAGMGYGYGQSIQANPYLDQVFQYYKDLWGQAGDLSKETYNKDPAIQDYQDTRAQGYKEQQAMAGGRGFGPGTGMSMAQMQRYGDTSNRGEQELAGNLWNAGLNQRTQLLGQMAGVLGGMTGAGSAIAGNQLGLGQLGLDQAKFGLNAWYTTNMLPIEMEKAKSGLLTNQLGALAQIGSLL